MHNDDITVRDWLTLIFLSLIWGSSFILMKKALVSFDESHLAALRIVISAGALSPILLVYRKKIDWSKWWQFLLIGVIGNGIPAILFFKAQTKISSSLSGLLNSMTPIWTLVIGIVIFGLPVFRQQIIGVVLGFVGASMLVVAGGTEGAFSHVEYGLIVVLATMLYGLSANLLKHYFQNTPPLLISAGALAAVSIPAWFYLLFVSAPQVDIYDNEVRMSFLALLVLSLVGTALSTIVFYALLQRTSAVFGSTVAYLMPIVAVAWGVLDGESIHMIHMIGIVSILVGVYVIRSKRWAK